MAIAAIAVTVLLAGCNSNNDHQLPVQEAETSAEMKQSDLMLTGQTFEEFQCRFVADQVATRAKNAQIELDGLQRKLNAVADRPTHESLRAVGVGYGNFFWQLGSVIGLLEWEVENCGFLPGFESPGDLRHTALVQFLTLQPHCLAVLGDPPFTPATYIGDMFFPARTVHECLVDAVDYSRWRRCSFWQVFPWMANEDAFRSHYDDGTQPQQASDCGPPPWDR